MPSSHLPEPVPMTHLEPVLLVLLFGSLAAATAALGALPFAGDRRPGPGWIGAAYALAGGFMLGAGYLLMSHGLELGTLAVVLGAGVAVAYTRWVQAYAGTADLEAAPGLEQGAEIGYKIILQNTLHSSAEGIAIGVAMAQNLRLGIFLALALAVHNVGEAMALTDELHRRGMTVGESAGLCVVTKVPQPLLAIVAFALAPALAGLAPALLGFAAGALVYLTLTELVPASYPRTGEGWVALLVSASAGAVVLLQSFFNEVAP